MLGWFLRVIIWRKCPFGEEKIEENHRNLLYILQNIQKKTISFRKLPIYNKKPMPLRKGIGFCQQSGRSYDSFFYLYKGVWGWNSQKIKCVYNTFSDCMYTSRKRFVCTNPLWDSSVCTNPLLAIFKRPKMT